jgi:hypothetical protein
VEKVKPPDLKLVIRISKQREDGGQISKKLKYWWTEYPEEKTFAPNA